jgi:hypothetical protein
VGVPILQGSCYPNNQKLSESSFAIYRHQTKIFVVPAGGHSLLPQKNALCANALRRQEIIEPGTEAYRPIACSLFGDRNERAKLLNDSLVYGCGARNRCSLIQDSNLASALMTTMCACASCLGGHAAMNAVIGSRATSVIRLRLTIL